MYQTLRFLFGIFARSCGVTICTRHQFIGGDALFLVASSDFICLVLVAAIAGIFDVICAMAGITLQLRSQIFYTMIDWKSMLAQACRAPRLGTVTIVAFQSKYPCVNVWFVMALPAFVRRASEDLIGMAIFTGDFRMVTFQGEEICMLEITQAVYPIVTDHAVGAKLDLVVSQKQRVVLAMAITT